MGTQKLIADKERLTEGLSSQKYVMEPYNTFANECANPQLRIAFMNIL